MQLTSKTKALLINIAIALAIFFVLLLTTFSNAFAETTQYNNHFTSSGQSGPFNAGGFGANGTKTHGEYFDPTSDYLDINAIKVKIVCNIGEACDNVSSDNFYVTVFETTDGNTLGTLVATSQVLESNRLINYATTTGTYFSPQNFYATTTLTSTDIFTQFNFTETFDIQNSKKYIILVSWNGTYSSGSNKTAGLVQTGSGAGRWINDSTPQTADVTTTTTSHSMSYLLLSDAVQYETTTQTPFQQTKAINIFSPNKDGSPYATSTPLIFWINTRKAETYIPPLYPCFTLKKLSTTFLTLELPDIQTFCKNEAIANGQETYTLEMTTSDISTYLESGKSYGAFPFLSTATTTTSKLNGSDGTPTVFSVGTLPNDIQDFYDEFVNATTTPQGWSCEVDVLLVGFDICEVSYYLIVPDITLIQTSLTNFQNEFDTRIPFAYMDDIQAIFLSFWGLEGEPTPPTLSVVLWPNTDPISVLSTSTPFYPDTVRNFFRELMSAGLYVGLLFAIFSLVKKIFNSQQK